MPRERMAFTLVELLVIITIIVLLLALLAPALDQAVYQAELTLCAARLDAGASATLTYAMSQRRMYPDRPLHTSAGAAAHQLAGSTQDERPTLRRAMGPLNSLLNCPLTQAVDIDGSQTFDTANQRADDAGNSRASPGIWVPYSPWMGWQYRVARSEFYKGMFRLGDRFTWPDASNAGTIERSFDLLISDTEVSDTDGYRLGSHPTREANRNNLVLQEGPNPWIAGGLTGAVTKVTLSWWQGPLAGTVDLNFAHQDGSVRRITEVRFQDPRLLPAWYYNDKNTRIERRILLPEQ